MAFSTYSSKSYNLEDLLNLIKIGNIALPDLQRPFIWNQTKVRDLFDSLYNGLPIGYILLWDTYSNNNVHQIGDKKGNLEPRLLVIDGQQRLTSLFSVIYGEAVQDSNFRVKEIKISFNPIDEIFEVHNAAIEKDPHWIPNVSDFYRAESEYQFLKEYLDRLKKKNEISEKEEKRISNNISSLKSILHYDISVLELRSDLDVEEVSEIFVRVNSKGVVLKQSDFILTLMSVHWPSGRKKLETFCKDSKTQSDFKSSSSFNHLIEPLPEHLVRTAVGLAFLRGRLKYAYLVLQGKNLQEKKSREISKTLRTRNFNRLKKAQKMTLDLTNWHDFIDILKSAGFVHKGMIVSKTAFFVSYALYLLGRYQYNITHRRLNRIIKKWFVFSILTKRYTSSPESTIERDYNLFKKRKVDFVKTLERVIETSLTSDFWRTTLPENLISSSSLNNGYIVYLASRNILDYKVMFSDHKIKDILRDVNELKHKKVPIEKHHIYPKNYLSKLGIDSQTDQNQVANYVFMEYKDNLEISDDSPKQYWSKYIRGFTKNKITRIKKANAIPDDFPDLDYRTFLFKRRKLMAKMIKKAFKEL